ncbi:MAG: hypothetical protein KBT12_08350 [Bacteroidales bacterium]|nr:hypothetical protein [Candidatus Physcousia equi]
MTNVLSKEDGVDVIEAYNTALGKLKSAMDDIDAIRDAISDAADDVRGIADEEQEH